MWATILRSFAIRCWRMTVAACQATQIQPMVRLRHAKLNEPGRAPAAALGPEKGPRPKVEREDNRRLAPARFAERAPAGQLQDDALGENGG